MKTRKALRESQCLFFAIATIFKRKPATVMRYNIFLPILAIVLVSACGSPGEDMKQADRNIAEAADTISPAADEAKGADNVTGYHTVQISTDYDKMVPLPEEMIKARQRHPVYLPGYESVDFTPGRYSYRYLLPEGEETITDLQGVDQQPPLFDESCLIGAEPLDCSNQKLNAYLAEQRSTAEEGNLTYAYLTLDERGTLERIDKVEVAKGIICERCPQAARKLLRRMPDWEPARLNGAKVKSQIVLPMYIIANGSAD